MSSDCFHHNRTTTHHSTNTGVQNCCPYSDTNGARSVRFISFTVQLEEYAAALLFHSTHIKPLENNHFKGDTVNF